MGFYKVLAVIITLAMLLIPLSALIPAPEKITIFGIFSQLSVFNLNKAIINYSGFYSFYRALQFYF